MNNKNKPTFDDLLARARKGTEADWDFVDANLGAEYLTGEQVEWAVDNGLGDDNDNIRDLAATIIAKYKGPLEDMDQLALLEQMEKDENVFVRHWLANALYKRGNRDPKVVDMWGEASKQKTPAGEFARSLK